MRTKLMTMLFGLCVVALLSSSAFAQDQSGEKSKSNVRTITGCLTQGDNAKEFNLTADDGSTWEVRSDGADLAAHVGHEVEATGVVSHAKMHNLKEDAKDTASDTGAKKNNTEHGHLTVTRVKMVSESCRK